MLDRLEVKELQRDVYLENDGSETIDMFFIANKKGKTNGSKNSTNTI